MPVTTRRNWDSTTDEDRYATQVSCRDCDASVIFQHAPTLTPRSDEADTIFRFHTGNERYLARCRDCERAHVRRWRENRRVSSAAVPGLALEGDRTFGVELECICAAGYHSIRTALEAEGLTSWRVRGDGSLPYNGVEIVSPPLRGQDGAEQLRKACRVLADLGASVNRACGTHVHHDASDLSLDDWKRLLRGWVDNQGVIDRLVSRSRRGGATYCQRWTSNEVAQVLNLQDLSHLRDGYLRVSRYKTLNVQSFPSHGTVEIRQHQGTLDADKILAWAEFGQAVIDRSKTAPIEHSTVTAGLFDQLPTLSAATRAFLFNRESALAAV